MPIKKRPPVRKQQDQVQGENKNLVHGNAPTEGDAPIIETNQKPGKSESQELKELFLSFSAEMNEKIASLKEENEELREQNKERHKSSSEGKEINPVEDWQDTPVLFYSFTYQRFIPADIRKNIEHVAPLGIIVFKPIVRRQQNGKTVCVSAFSTNSKAEIKFLKNHSDLGTLFFEDMESARTLDYNKSMHLFNAQTTVKTFSDQMVISQCKDLHIEMDKSMDINRSNLVSHMAQSNMTARDFASSEISKMVSNPITGNPTILTES